MLVDLSRARLIMDDEFRKVGFRSEIIDRHNAECTYARVPVVLRLLRI